MKFFAAVNCMDGRVQLPVNTYLKDRFDVDYIDTITEPGPNRILAEQENETAIESILARLRISVEKHKASGIAVIGHHYCAGNPVAEDKQRDDLEKAVSFLNGHFDVPVISLWVDDQWSVKEI